MEIKTVKKMVETEVTVYVAYDGTEFNNQTLCKAYESTQYKKKYEELPHITFNIDEIFPDADSPVWYKAIPVRNKGDMAIINSYIELESSNSEYVSEDYIGKVILMAEPDNEVWFCDDYTIKDMAEEIVNNLNKIILAIKLMGDIYLKK